MPPGLSLASAGVANAHTIRRPSLQRGAGRVGSHPKSVRSLSKASPPTPPPTPPLPPIRPRTGTWLPCNTSWPFYGDQKSCRIIMFFALGAPVKDLKALVKDLLTPLCVCFAPWSFLWPLGAPLGSFCVLLGPHWADFEAMLDHVGPIWRHFRSLLEPCCLILALSGALWHHFRSLLEPSWPILALSGAYLPRSKKTNALCSIQPGN